MFEKIAEILAKGLAIAIEGLVQFFILLVPFTVFVIAVIVIFACLGAAGYTFGDGALTLLTFGVRRRKSKNDPPKE